MPLLHDIRESKVWQEAYQIGFQKGLLEAREERDRDDIKSLREIGRTHKEIAKLLGFSLYKVCRLARSK